MAFPESEDAKKVFTNRIIPAAGSTAAFERVLLSDASCFFLLFGDLISLPVLCRNLASAKKTCFVHADFIEGLSGKDVAVDFLANLPSVRGIISTRPNLIRRAGELGLKSVERFFILDSRALQSATRRLSQSRPDFVELLPGVADKAIRRIKSVTNTPLIAGGLIETKEEAARAFAAGADYVSTSEESLWNMTWP